MEGNTPHINIKKFQIFSFLSIVLLIAIFYYPSLSHLPRSDHWAYLVDTLEQDGVWDTLKHTYTYNRTRLMAPGDTALFRPVLFFVLALEKGLFGNHFQYIQATGILLHILVIFLLIIILNQIRGLLDLNSDRHKDFYFNIFGFLFIAFYALNFTFTEIVIWMHLHGYLVFHVFTLLSFALILKFISLPKNKTVSSMVLPILVWFLLLLATFTYEYGQILSLLTGILFFLVLKKKGLLKGALVALTFIAIPLIYQYINVIDLKIHQISFRTDITPGSVFRQALDFATFEHSLRLFGYFVVHPFFPSLAVLKFTSRVVIGELRGDEVDIFIVASILVFAAWGIITFLGTRALARGTNKSLKYFSLFILFVFLGYFGLIVFGRLNMRPGFGVITTSTYYVYYPLCYLMILTLILLGHAIASDSFMKFKFARLMRGTLTFGLPVIIALSLINISKINTSFVKADSTFRNIVAKIERFVDEHPNTKLSFDLEHGEGIMQGHGIPISTVLFRKYEDNFKPDYVVMVTQTSDVNFIPAAFYRKYYNLADDKAIVPTLIKTGTLYHIYKHEWAYVAVQQNDGPFLPTRGHYSYMPYSPSLEELEQKMIPAMIEKRRKDIIDGIYLSNFSVVIDPIEKNYRGFTIVRSLDLFYATPKIEGKFEIERLKSRDYSVIYESASLEEVKSFIDFHVLNATLKKK